MAQASDGAVPTVPRLVGVEVDGRAYDVRLHVTEPPWADMARRRRARQGHAGGAAGNGAVVSPMQGTVLKVAVADGDAVGEGDLLLVVEAMKMENEIVAPREGVVSGLAVTVGRRGVERPASLRRRRAGRGNDASRSSSAASWATGR